jgi:hypothetical protein
MRNVSPQARRRCADVSLKVQDGRAVAVAGTVTIELPAGVEFADLNSVPCSFLTSMN